MATKKLTALTAGTPEDGDIAYIVKDPTGTPVDRKANVSDFGLLKMASVELTDAQIKALPTTDVEIIAAPGAGKAILLFGWWMRVNWTADYTNIHAAATFELHMGISSGILDNTVASGVSALLAGGGPDGVSASGSFAGYCPPGAGSTRLTGQGGYYDSDVEDEPLMLVVTNADGNFTGGDVANMMTVTVYYVVVDL